MRAGGRFSLASGGVVGYYRLGIAHQGRIGHCQPRVGQAVINIDGWRRLRIRPRLNGLRRAGPRGRERVVLGRVQPA